MSLFSLGGAKHAHAHTHYAHAHLLCLSPDLHFFPRRRYTTFHKTLEHTVGLSHNHSYKNTNTVLHIYSNTHTNVNTAGASFTNTRKKCRGTLERLFEQQLFSKCCRVLVSVFFFRMGGIPARTHKDEKLLIYLGIIDILQSYRY